MAHTLADITANAGGAIDYLKRRSLRHQSLARPDMYPTLASIYRVDWQALVDEDHCEALEMERARQAGVDAGAFAVPHEDVSIAG